MNRWDETWHRLLDWTNGQAPSERLSAQILLNEGFSDLDPSHPLGGPDRKHDAICRKCGKRWIMAVYFPRGQQDFNTIRRKFDEDFLGIEEHEADGISFVTNQELRLSERQAIKDRCGDKEVDLYHLERITTILDQPGMAAVRAQFLGIVDEQEILVLGGEGGNAPGAGGGGGAALGMGAIGGRGGRGGDIRLDGLPGRLPAAGGGGGGAQGPDAIGGEGGGGGEFVEMTIRAEDMPGVVNIRIGAGGLGGEAGMDGQTGGDTELGDLVRAKGGEGGRAGYDPHARVASRRDVNEGLRVSSIWLAEAVRMKNGLIDLWGGGWTFFNVPELPFKAEWPLVGTVCFPESASAARFEFCATVTDPLGARIASSTFVVSRPDGSVGASNWFVPLNFELTMQGVWSVSVGSGSLKLSEIPIEVVLKV